MIDFDTMTLPNSLTQSGLVIGLGWQTWLGFTVGGTRGALQYLFLSIFSAVIGIWLFDLIRILGTVIFGKPAMGGGDPKLTAMIGSWLGWQGVLLTGFLACLVGTIVGGGAIVLKLLKKGQPMAFGPYLVLGAISTIFWGDRILSSYLQYIGL
jgi:leader peptidase (prepilin peptidase)/N-methyltransferase